MIWGVGRWWWWCCGVRVCSTWATTAPSGARRCKKPPLINHSRHDTTRHDTYKPTLHTNHAAQRQQQTTQLQRLQARENDDGSGALVPVALDQDAFRDLISVLADE